MSSKGQKNRIFLFPPHLSHHKRHVAQLLALQQVGVVVAQRALRVRGELEAVDLPAADVVVDCATEYVHGVMDTGRSMEQAAGRDGGFTAGLSDRPGLRVKIVAEQG